MARVITFSRAYPAGHPKQGRPTNFVEKIVQYKSWFDFRTWILENNKKVDGDILLDFIAKIDPDDFAPKIHTIRSVNKKTGEGRWKVGDKASLRVWSDKPYSSKQIIIAPEVEISRVIPIEILEHGIKIYSEFNKCWVSIGSFNDFGSMVPELAKNDGLDVKDFESWFKLKELPFKGDIIFFTDAKTSY